MERKTSVRVFGCSPTGGKPETQVCALIKNGNVNLLVDRKTPNQLSHTGWLHTSLKCLNEGVVLAGHLQYTYMCQNNISLEK